MEEVGSSGAPTRSTRLLWTAVVIAVVAFVLGVVGFLRAGVPFPSAVYSTLQLFTLNFAAPNDSGSYPVVLEIARFLAPAVTLLAAGTIAARLFRDEFDRTTARYAFRGAGNHVIVCGLGDLGTTTVRLLCGDRHVVAIEHDRSCPAISTVRSLGVPVVVGDGRVERTLERAGIGSASLLIWTTGGFAVGSDVATFVVSALRGDDANRRRAARSVEDRPPACLVRVRDLGLCELLRRAVLTDRAGLDDVDVPAPDRQLDPDVDYFNEWENTAERLIWDVLRGYAETPGDVDLWVAGGGPLAEALIVQAVRTWRGLDPPRTDARLAIHVFDEHAGDQRDRFTAAWPEAARGVRPGRARRTAGAGAGARAPDGRAAGQCGVRARRRARSGARAGPAPAGDRGGDADRGRDPGQLGADARSRWNPRVVRSCRRRRRQRHPVPRLVRLARADGSRAVPQPLRHRHRQGRGGGEPGVGRSRPGVAGFEPRLSRGSSFPI